MLWQKPLSGPGLGGLAATQEVVIYGDRDALDGMDVFRCLSARDGSVLWTVMYPAKGKLDYGNTPRATPLIHEDLVYLQGAHGDLVAVELNTGKEVWRKQFQRDFGANVELPWGYCGSPLVVEGRVIVMPGGDGCAIVALDPRTGEKLWATAGDPPAYGSLIAWAPTGRWQVIGHDSSALCGWDITSGERLWRLEPESNDDFNVPTPQIWKGQLLVASENNGTRQYAFDASGKLRSEPVATNSEFSPDIASPVISGSRFFGLWGELFCLDLDGALGTVWKHADKGFRAHGSCFACDGRILIATAGGELILIDATADRWSELGRLRVLDDEGAELYSHPAIVGSRLYWRGESQIVCIELNRAARR